MFNEYLAEGVVLKQGVIPQDVNGAAQTGARLKMDDCDRVAIVLSCGDSTGAVLDVTLRQHDAASAGTSKDLEVANKYYHKAGAATSFTKVEPTVAAANYVLSSVFANDEGIVVLEVESAQLDVENGFAWVSLDVADSTAAKVVGVMYHGHPALKKPAYELDV